MNRSLPTTLLLLACSLTPVAAQQTPSLTARPDGSLVGQGTGFAASFDDMGAQLVVADPDATQPPLAMRLRLVDWGRNGARRVTAPVAVERVADGVARFVHDDIVERYGVTERGFDQSFVLAQRPAGTGDLVLGVEVLAPQLHAAPAAPAHQALEFAAGDRAVVRYGEAFVFARGGEPAPIATRFDGISRIELIVPGAFLDVAAYPVVVDPAVGPILEPSGASWNDSRPDVAFEPVTGNYLVVWQREFSVNDVRIRAQRYRRDGTPLGGTTLVTGQGFYTWPTVAAGRSPSGSPRFLIAWSSSLGLQGRQYDAATGATVTSGPQALTTVAPSVRDRRPALSFGNTDWMLAWDRTPSGAAEPTEVRVRTLTQPGNTTLTLGNEHVVEAVTGGYVRRPRMARRHLFQGAPLVRLVWERFYTSPAPGDTDLRTAYFSAASSIAFLQSPSSVPGASSIGVEESRHDVAAVDDPFAPNQLVVWDENGDVKGHRFVGNGPVGSEIAIRTGATVDTAPAVGAGASEFSVAYVREVSTFEDAVYAARVLADGTVAVDGRQISTGLDWTHSHLRASSTFETTSPNETNMVMLAWWLETTQTGVQNDVRARRVDPVAASVSPFGAACPGPGGTLPTIAAIGEPYPGNAEFAFGLGNAPAGTLCALLASQQFTTTPIPGAPGCELYAGLPLVAAFPTLTDGAGQASVPLAIPLQVPPGAALAFQWAIYTPGHNAFGWIVSDDLDVYWNQ